MKGSLKDIQELGRAFVALGETLQKPESTLGDIAAAAHACGLNVGFTYASRTASDEPTPIDEEDLHL